MVGRAQASNVLIVNGAFYIVDAGEGVTRRLTRAGIPIRDIDNIFITHPHSDHTGGLGGLLSTEYDYSRTKPVDIYGPPGTDEITKALVQFLTVSADIRISEGMRTVPAAKIFFGHDTGVGVIYQDANVKVTAAENSHFNFRPGTPAYGKYKSYSYRFETADRVVVFSGDTGPSDALVELAKGADLLVSEVMSLEEWKELQIKTGRWQSMTPEQQARAVRRQVEEHITPDEIGKTGDARRRQDRRAVSFSARDRSEGRLRTSGRAGEEALLRQGAGRQGPDGVLTGGLSFSPLSIQVIEMTRDGIGLVAVTYSPDACEPVGGLFDVALVVENDGE